MKDAFLFLFFASICLSSVAQIYTERCSNNEHHYPGKASYNIDGGTNDWQALLGSYSGNPSDPYTSAMSKSTFNSTLDQGCAGATTEDRDFPASENDVRFLASTYDDFNLYFYFRKLTNSNGVKSFYYFIDTNADGFMGSGEPVISGVFNGKNIIKYSYGYYIPNKTIDFISAQGNYMYSPSTELVDGYSMPGTVLEVYSSKKINEGFNLSSNEIFDAAITEDGFGVELSIPWKLLSGATNLNANSIITYHVALQDMGFPYRADKVEDNAGECCGWLGIIGESNYVASNSYLQTLVNQSSYKLTTQLTNTSNITEQIGLNMLVLDDIVGPVTVDRNAIEVKAYTDVNCNGITDAGETPVIFYPYMPPVSDNMVYKPTSSFTSQVSSGEKVCYIIIITFPPNSRIQSFTPILDAEVAPFRLPSQCSRYGCGPIDNGRPINPVGFQGEVEEPSTSLTPLKKAIIAEKIEFSIHPNPSTGSVKLSIKGNAKEIEASVIDNGGRVIRNYKDLNTSNIGINDLRSGSYMIILNNKRTGEKITKRLVVIN